MKEQRENKVIETKYLIASYMVNFETSNMTRNEYYSYAEFLENNVSTKNTKYDILVGEEYLRKLNYEGLGSTFRVGPKYISIEPGSTINYLRRFILTKLDSQTLEDLSKATDKYKEMISGLQKI